MGRGWVMCPTPSPVSGFPKLELNQGISMKPHHQLSARPTPDHTSDRERAQTTGRPARILIVEDNEFVAHQFDAALTQAGYEVIDLVVTAERAIEVAMDRLPDLVLMDIYLPGPRDGIDAAIEILEQFGIRSIFVSAVSDPATRDRSERAKPLAWLPKPFGEAKLVATVRTALAQVQPPMELRA